MAEYMVEFETLAAESGWNEPALLYAFRRGLNDQVCDALVVGLQPRELSELIDRAIELDNFQCERRWEQALRFAPARSFGLLRSPPPCTPLPCLADSPPPRVEKPMQLGGVPWSLSL